MSDQRPSSALLLGAVGRHSGAMRSNVRLQHRSWKCVVCTAAPTSRGCLCASTWLAGRRSRTAQVTRRRHRQTGASLADMPACDGRADSPHGQPCSAFGRCVREPRQLSHMGLRAAGLSSAARVPSPTTSASARLALALHHGALVAGASGSPASRRRGRACGDGCGIVQLASLRAARASRRVAMEHSLRIHGI